MSISKEGALTVVECSSFYTQWSDYVCQSNTHILCNCRKYGPVGTFVLFF